MVNYDDCDRLNQKHTIKSWQEKQFVSSGKFPNCKGMFPDCPETPNKKHKMCRSCPKIE